MLEILLMPLLVILFGLISCFAGKRLFALAIALLGFLLGFYVTFFLLCGFIEDKNILLIIAIVIAILFGLLMKGIYHVGIFILGAVFTFLLLNSGLLPIDGQMELVIKLAISVAGGVIALVCQSLVVVVATAGLGAYALVFGSIFLIQSFKHGNLSTMRVDRVHNFLVTTMSGDSLYLALFAVGILAVIGFVVQMRMFPRGEE